MMRSKVIRGSAGYDSNFGIIEDHEVWARIVYEHKCCNLQDRLIDLRVHSHSMGHRYDFQTLGRFMTTIERACESGLGHPAPRGWADLWIRANNPCLYAKDIDLNKIAKSINDMHSQFVRYNKVTMDDAITYHRNRLLIRTAYHALS